MSVTRWEGATRAPVIEHEDATDAQILEATFMGYRVQHNEVASELYPWMVLTPGRPSVFNRYYTEREAWSAAWLLLRNREGVEA